MDSIVEHYYKVNRLVLMTLGLWPYQQSYFTQIHNALFAGILLSFIVVQLLVFITRQYSTTLLFMILSFIFPNLFVTMKYFIFIIKADSLKQLLEQIQDDWNSLKDNLEIDVIKKYASNVRLYTLGIMACCYIGIIIFGGLQCLPLIVNIIIPFNESIPLKLFAITEYVIIGDKFIYIMILHELLVIYIGFKTICITGVTIMIFIAHICALLKIASYRIEKAIESNILAIPSPRREHLIHWRIVRAIVIHQRAIEYHEFFCSVFLVPFSFLIIVGIGGLVFTLLLVFQQMKSNDKSVAIIALMFVLVYLIYLFIGNYCGQTIIDNGINFFEATYNGLWYAAPLSAQKLLLFVMQRGRTPPFLTCYGIFVASLDGFATLTKMAISYFMVLHSTQK